MHEIKKTALSRQALGGLFSIVTFTSLPHNGEQIKQASNLMIKIPLIGKRGTGMFTLISNEDYDRVFQYNWILTKDGYAQASIAPFRLHVFIMQPSGGMVVDHINRDRLDNRRDNLRVCTAAENSRNRRIGRNNTTGYKGLVRMSSGLWKARIYHNGQYIDLGIFMYAAEAARTYNDAAIRYFGEFACLNEIEGAE